MDLREKKTKRSIKNAFIELRAKKPLERISVKELVELAEISKATFYLHYRDIYDLSNCLQKEVIKNVLDSLGQPDLLLTDSMQFTKELFSAFHAQQSLIDILFSDSQAAVLPLNIESALREYIFEYFPEEKNNAEFNIMLSYKIHGGYYAYQENFKKFGLDTIIETLDKLEKTKPLAEWKK